MRSLIAEDDRTSRTLLQTLLARHGDCDAVEDGLRAVDAYRMSLDCGDPYDLVCLDIMMPRMDGQTVLREIRALESNQGVAVGKGAKIIMTTALGDPKNVMRSFREQCDAYLIKPIDHTMLQEQLQQLGLVDESAA